MRSNRTVIDNNDDSRVLFRQRPIFPVVPRERRDVLSLSPCGRGWPRCEASRTGEGSRPLDRKRPLIRRGLRIADAKHRRPTKERRPKAACGHLLPQGEKGRNTQCYSQPSTLTPHPESGRKCPSRLPPPIAAARN